MTTALIDRTTTSTVRTAAAADVRTDVRTAVRDAYLDAAALVAELDLDDRRAWRQADPIVAELAGTAYDLAGRLSGTPPVRTAAHVPPVVRVRELASALRRLFAALDRHPVPEAAPLRHADRHARQLTERLRRTIGR